MARCTSCSAPLPAHETVCAYCGTRNSVDLKGVHEYTVAVPESERLCPRCGDALQTLNLHTAGTFLLEQCPTCFGLFFDPGELEALLETSVANVFQIDRQRLGALVQALGPRPVEYGRCPVCRAFMNRVNFGSRSGVVVDRCRNHGVWLDGGELRQLLEWRKAGGQLLHEQLRAEREQEAARAERDNAALGKALREQGGGPGDAWDEGQGSFDLAGLLLGLVGRLFR